MRIGDKENFLSIECGSNDEVAVLAFEAGTFHGKDGISARLWSLGEWSLQNQHDFANFENLKAGGFEMRLIMGGWLRLERDHRGWIAVRYRLTGRRLPHGAAMEGEIWIEGEYAGSFCRELRTVLEAQL
jgi:hypothetical protein